MAADAHKYLTPNCRGYVLHHNMYVHGVRLRNFSHCEWQKLNILNNTLVGVRFAAFSLEVKQVRQFCSVY